MAAARAIDPARRPPLARRGSSTESSPAQSPRQSREPSPKGGDDQRVRVFVRLRPPSKGDGEPIVRTDAARRLIWLGANRDGCVAGAGPGAAAPMQFEVDRVLTPAEDQGAVFGEVAQPVVEAVSRGATGCIMCYGQTGAGKTYTLAGGGGGGEGGIVGRTLRQLLPAGAAAGAAPLRMAYVQVCTELLTKHGPACAGTSAYAQHAHTERAGVHGAAAGLAPA